LLLHANMHSKQSEILFILTGLDSENMLHRQMGKVNNLLGADDSFWLIGAVSVVYVNTGFPRLNICGPTSHKKHKIVSIIIISVC